MPLRSSEVQHRSGNQDKNTADSQKQKKLSFKPHLLIMMIETLSGTILLRNFHLTKSDTSSFSDSIFSERREEIAEDIPAPAEDVPAPAPAPAPTLKTVEE